MNGRDENEARDVAEELKRVIEDGWVLISDGWMMHSFPSFEDGAGI